MAEIPHFTGGQYGKLTSEVLNDIVDAAIRQRESIDKTNYTATPNRYAGGGFFPIIARLLDRVEEKDDPGGGAFTVGGYKWEEEWFRRTTGIGTWSHRANSRQYTAQMNNAAFIAGASFGNPLQQPELKGYTVLLNMYHDQDGKALLVFQWPYKRAARTQPGVIIGKPTGAETCDMSGTDGLYRIQLLKWSVKSESWIHDIEEEEIEAINGVELNNMGDIGGSIESPSCDVTVRHDWVALDTVVLVTESEGHWMFSIPNDVCVTCCEEPGALMNSSAAVSGVGGVVYPGASQIRRVMRKNIHAFNSIAEEMVK